MPVIQGSHVDFINKRSQCQGLNRYPDAQKLLSSRRIHSRFAIHILELSGNISDINASSPRLFLIGAAGDAMDEFFRSAYPCSVLQTTERFVSSVCLVQFSDAQ